MQLTKQLLMAALVGTTAAEADKFLGPINQTLAAYHINTPLRVAHFLAQIGHESCGLDAVREYASGVAYEGRKDLGNVVKGDGVKFRGRGLIQITGRANYYALSKAFNVDFIANPLLLESPTYAALSAGWYWNSRSLNAMADGNFFDTITKRINGGTNGYADRLNRFLVAAKALGIPGGVVPKA
ncbi:glycoside hydrolase family 19 protein [Hymenobacter psychrotolerans]|uniref:Putative chitinase n=1 Tax=Hymenobacter psychrotolerans DSM 18569 TaxID=1121959 RepID=A0A1M6Z778_9BACT|nr:glycoside hydrolase family 19 protein [Hymenobacter psychrotolerans]SHL26326.1 putative chitinase [Hymenobacter psychrotolerans DSM 18569]